MKTKPLIETNPYLKNSVTRKKLIARSVRTSCGVEGIKKKEIMMTKENLSNTAAHLRLIEKFAEMFEAHKSMEDDIISLGDILLEIKWENIGRALAIFATQMELSTRPK